ncbi:flagellar hook protein FlgE [Endozoicomonas arenosclerae]|uniref:flagellar hook protein FlgE n=1 Tax=Endozoicomonas arenosclerae TaxID=1633495 RepID=UPI000781C9E2|nr:flagellar hook protein FlgE [Endozoicomonas arenosclerae]
MSFGIGLSGLNAARQDLDVISNNIANSNTVGFKGSRTEFADLYASSVGGSASKGTGVQLANTAQQFSQGDRINTENSLDMMITGNGYFVVDQNGEKSFTRAGYFALDSDKNVVNNQGLNLQGYAADAAGNILPGTLTDLKIGQSELPATATTSVTGSANLDSRNTVPGVGTFNPSDPNSYNNTMAFNVYDSQGNPHTLSMYFVKDATPNQWTVNFQFDNATINDAGGTPISSQTITFNSSGQLATGGTFSIPVPEATNASLVGVADMTMNIDLSTFSQLGSDFTVNKATQDGFPPGQLTGLEVSKDGVLKALYSNGQSAVQGQIVLAAFPNDNGLIPSGDSLWSASFASGSPLFGAAGKGSMGQLQSAALEQSNVDLSRELVRLIEAQRNYQANAKTIETSSSLTQTLMQII